MSDRQPLDEGLITMSAVSHPQLKDHTVDAHVVVPAAYAIEWFARAVQNEATLPTKASPLALNDIRVLNGVTAPGFAAGGTTELRLATTEQDRLLLVDPGNGRPRYSCTTGPDPLRVRPAGSTTISSTWPDPGVDVTPYGSDSVLFHGPAFQVLSETQVLPDVGVTSMVAGVVHTGWPQEPWVSDPAMIDGLLQLALLWHKSQLGMRSLPTSIASLRLLAPPASGTLSATLTGVDTTRIRVRSDIAVTDATGSLVAELLGVETHSLAQPGDQ